MRPFWTFVASFLCNASSSMKCRLPAVVRNNLVWWNTLLPTFNKVFFFDDLLRDIFQLYTNASLTGLGDFFFHRAETTWPNVFVSQSNAFFAQTSDLIYFGENNNPAFASHSTQSEAATPTAIRLGVSTDTFILTQTLSINTFEVEAILLNFEQFSRK